MPSAMSSSINGVDGVSLPPENEPCSPQSSGGQSRLEKERGEGAIDSHAIGAG